MLIATEKWLLFTFAEASTVGLRSRLQQIEPRAPIHLSFDELQARDFSFGLPFGPWRDDRIPDGGQAFSTPLANELTRLSFAAYNQSSNFVAVLDRIMNWKLPMVGRATTSSGTLTSIAATKIASDFARSSRAVVNSLAMTRAGGVRANPF